VITFQAQFAAGATKLLQHAPFSTRLANAVLAYVGYLGQAIWPLDLAVFYPYEFPAWSDGRVLAGAGLLFCLSAGVISLGKRSPYLLVGWLWFLGTLAPVIGIIQVGLLAKADRYT
jgi:hypothetical protein